MKRRIIRGLAILCLATALTGCSTINRTLNGVLQLPTSLINSASRTVGNIAG